MSLPQLMKRLVSVSLLIVFMVLSAMAQNFPVTRHAYIAKFLKSKITALIWYEETEDGDLSGEIIYTSSKHQTPIRIFGIAYEMDDGVCRHQFFEYQADGERSGHFEIDRDPRTSKLSAQWGDMRNDDSQRTYTLRLTPTAFPADKGGTFTLSDDITGRYVYKYQHHFKGSQGGNVIINHLKGNPGAEQLTITKYDPQIAEYDSHAIFHNGCYNDELEDCGYQFVVYVFKDFVRVKTTSDIYKEYDCFGAFTTLDGFYLKVEE